MPALNPRTDVSTAILRELVTQRFRAPEWGLVWEVPDGTGARKSRTLDALAMSLWPSRGLELHGLELKTVRSDLAKELRDPAKADAVGAYCDRFWIVAPKGLARPEDLPVTWGLLEATPKTLRVAKEPDKLEPQPIDHVFLAALFRRVSVVCAEYVPRADIADEINAARREARENAIENLESDAAWTQRKLDELRREVKKFETAAGVKIGTWNAGNVGAAVRLVLAGQTENVAARLARSEREFRRLADDVAKSLAAWNESRG